HRGVARVLLERLHNPGAYVCDCVPECWCKRSRIGHLIMWYVPSRFHRRPSDAAARVDAVGVLTVLLVLAALASSVLLLASDSSAAFRASREREILSSVPLIAIALACLAFHASWKPQPFDLLKRILKSAAFLSWAATQLAPHAPWSPVATDIAISLFVLDLALVLWGELGRRSR